MAFDLVIRNGTVIDRTGGPPALSLDEQRRVPIDPDGRRRLVEEATHGSYGRTIGAETSPPDFTKMRVMRNALGVFDPDTVAPRLPVVVHDLPGGARRLDQRAYGFLATIVAGESVVEHGAHTGAHPGRLIRRARAVIRKAI